LLYNIYDRSGSYLRGSYLRGRRRGDRYLGVNRGVHYSLVQPRVIVRVQPVTVRVRVSFTVTVRVRVRLGLGLGGG